MARKLRFETEGGLYHVINRGNHRSWIFKTDGAKHAFEKTLRETCERSGWILHAWVIMGAEPAISRYCAELRDGKRPGAMRLYKQLSLNSKD